MGADLSLRVYSSANAFSAATISIPPNLVVTDAQPFIKRLSDFTQGQGAVSPVDWTNVNRIEMFIHGSVNLDVSIGDLVMCSHDSSVLCPPRSSQHSPATDY